MPNGPPIGGPFAEHKKYPDLRSGPVDHRMCWACSYPCRILGARTSICQASMRNAVLDWRCSLRQGWPVLARRDRTLFGVWAGLGPEDRAWFAEDLRELLVDAVLPEMA